MASKVASSPPGFLLSLVMVQLQWVGQPHIIGNQTAHLVLVTLGIAGVQFAWGIEQAYVNIYLLELGLSKSGVSLVWIFGPLCGIIVPPVVGVFSDFCTSRHGRRRPFMMGSTFVIMALFGAFAWAKELAHVLSLPAAVVATAAVLLLDIAVNICNTSCRTIVIDMLPKDRQKAANAWGGRMTSVGHLLSYYLGSLNLEGIFGTQLKGICTVSAVALFSCVGITCLSVTERVLVAPLYRPSRWAQLRFKLGMLWSHVVNLDPELASIFRVQLYGWFSWFTFMFFGATWASELWRLSNPSGSVGESARAGAWALTLFSLSATFFAFVLPTLPFNLVFMWGVSYVVYALAMAAVGFAHSYTWAVTIFMICGFSWALNMWAPFSLTGERVHQLPAIGSVDETTSIESETDVVTCHELSGDDVVAQEMFSEESGVYLGLLYSSIMLPQIASTIISFIVFRLVDGDPSHGDDGYAIGVTLRIGTITALLAAYATTRVSSKPISL